MMTFNGEYILSESEAYEFADKRVNDRLDILNNMISVMAEQGRINKEASDSLVEIIKDLRP